MGGIGNEITYGMINAVVRPRPPLTQHGCEGLTAVRDAAHASALHVRLFHAHGKQSLGRDTVGLSYHGHACMHARKMHACMCACSFFRVTAT